MMTFSFPPLCEGGDNRTHRGGFFVYPTILRRYLEAPAELGRDEGRRLNKKEPEPLKKKEGINPFKPKEIRSGSDD